MIFKEQSITDDEENMGERTGFDEEKYRSKFLEERKGTERERGYVSELLSKNVFSHRKV